eukprot:232254-Rhodomonas_salina.1
MKCGRMPHGDSLRAHSTGYSLTANGKAPTQSCDSKANLSALQPACVPRLRNLDPPGRPRDTHVRPNLAISLSGHYGSSNAEIQHQPHEHRTQRRGRRPNVLGPRHVAAEEIVAGDLSGGHARRVLGSDGL